MSARMNLRVWLASMIGAFAVIVGIWAAVHSTKAESKIDLGQHHEVYYAGEPKADAEAVGRALKQVEFFIPGMAAKARVRHDGDRHVVELVVKDSIVDRSKRPELHQYAEPISAIAFHGEPLDLWIVEALGETPTKLRWEARPEAVIDLGQEHLVHYRDGATRREAQAVADYLKKNFFTGAKGASSVYVQREGDRHIVVFVGQEISFDNQERKEIFYRLGIRLSVAAFDGEPLDVWLADEHVVPRVKLTWETRAQGHLISLGHGREVIFRHDATETEAMAVGAALHDYFEEYTSDAAVIVEYEQGRPVVAFVVNDWVFTNTESQDRFHARASALSDAAFGGKPVDIWLVDDEKVPHIKLAWQTRP